MIADNSQTNPHEYGRDGAGGWPRPPPKPAMAKMLHILKGGSKPDMIIADLNMAAMNGIQLIHEISRLPGHQFTLPKLVAASSGSI